MGIDAGALMVAGTSLALSILFTFWFVRQQTNAVIDQAKYAMDAADAANRQAAIAEQVRQEQVEPYVVVDIRPSDHVGYVFVLVIENTGPTVARNVQIKFDPPLERVEETLSGWPPIRDALFLKEGIPFMSPGRRIEWFFDVGFKRLDSDLPKVYTVTVDTEGPFGRVETLTYRIDLSMYGGLNTLGVKNLHDGVKTLEKVVVDLEHLSRAVRESGTEPLTVDRQ